MAERDEAIAMATALQRATWEASLLGTVPTGNARAGRSDNAQTYYDGLAMRPASVAEIDATPGTAVASTEAVDTIKLWLDTLYVQPE